MYIYFMIKMKFPLAGSSGAEEQQEFDHHSPHWCSKCRNLLSPTV